MLSSVDMSYLWTTGNASHISHTKRIAFGGYSEVHQLFNAAKQKAFARKVVRPFGGFTKVDAENESHAILKIYKDGASHQNIVRVLDHGWLSSPYEYYFIDMELCQFNLHDYIYGDRSDLFKDLFLPSDTLLNVALVRQDDFVCMKVANVYTIIMQVVSGLEYIHSCGQVHRDLKPQNSMVYVEVANVVLYYRKGDVWKIADFGTSAEGTSKNARMTLFSRGTSGYRAPEVLREDAIYTNKVDIWAIGCILYELAAGNKAFHEDWAVREYAVGSDEISLPEVSFWPSFANSQLFSLLKQLLHKKWDKRPDTKSVHSSLLTSIASMDEPFSSDEFIWMMLTQNHPEARYLHSQYTAHWESRTDYDTVIDGWKRLAGDYPTEENMHEELSRAIARKGDYLLAASVWQELLERHPDIRTFERRLQHACLKIGDQDLAVGMTRLRKVADKYPRNLGLQRSLAVWYSTRGDMGDEMIDLCKRNLGERSDRRSERYWWAANLATAYEYIEDHSAALGVWKAAAILHQDTMMQGNSPLLPLGQVFDKLSDAFERVHPSSHLGRKAAWSELMSSFPCLLTPEEEGASGINWKLIVAGESGPRSLAIDPHNPKDFENVSSELETADTATDSLPSLPSIREQQLAQELSAKTNELADVRKALTEAKQILKKLKEPRNRPANALGQPSTSKPAGQKVRKVSESSRPGCI